MKIVHEALALVKPQFRLDIDHGWHGISHWSRVWLNARLMCRELGVDETVPCWFAFMHDSQRHDEGMDYLHGHRAANWVRGLQATKKLTLTDEQLNDLCSAMERHSDGVTSGPLVQQICWDADRLDLGRVGIRPDPRYLCTDVAKDPTFLSTAYARFLGVGRHQAII